ncbi:MAG: nucleotidyltransferase domain-containing protein [Muribaculaceae bacterium]|nr:nucleotidyltransferase domain-containing protein [Muribaculaceae bacterium]
MINLDAIKKCLSKEPVIKAWLFGSYARGEEREDSDVDILVEFDKNAKVGLLRHAQLILLLEGILNKPVDLVPHGAVYSNLRERINREKILIYERGR